MAFQENVLLRVSTEVEVKALLPDSIVIDMMGLAWQLLETTQGHAWLSTMPGGTPSKAHYFTEDIAEFVHRRGPFLAAPYVIEDDDEEC